MTRRALPFLMVAAITAVSGCTCSGDVSRFPVVTTPGGGDGGGNGNPDGGGGNDGGQNVTDPCKVIVCPPVVDGGFSGTIEFPPDGGFSTRRRRGHQRRRRDRRPAGTHHAQQPGHRNQLRLDRQLEDGNGVQVRHQEPAPRRRHPRGWPVHQRVRWTGSGGGTTAPRPRSTTRAARPSTSTGTCGWQTSPSTPASSSASPRWRALLQLRGPQRQREDRHQLR